WKTHREISSSCLRRTRQPIARQVRVRRPAVPKQQAALRSQSSEPQKAHAPGSKPAVDPRIERSRRVILQAVPQEIRDLGYGALTIESAARRAGVGKATIYRHWPDKIALIADAFKLLQQQRDPELDTGSPREKLERSLRHVADVVAASPFSSCLPALIEGAE